MHYCTGIRIIFYITISNLPAVFAYIIGLCINLINRNQLEKISLPVNVMLCAIWHYFFHEKT